MTEISFEDLEIDPDRISVRAVTTDESYDLWFDFSDPLPVSSTSVAVALSTLCGRTYKRIKYDFPVSNSVLGAIRELTLADIETGPEERYVPGARQGTLLSFSGGFDSLAAKAVMPSDTCLVSMDFGGRFARERAFFEKFSPVRVSTNIVDTPLRSNSWSFMGIGAILASDYFRTKYHTFGGILEAGADNIREAPVAARNDTFPPFKGAGYINAPYVIGLTEIGTLTVILRTWPELLGESLVSLASPGEEKINRKAVLARLVAETIGVQADIPDIPAPSRPHFQFGQNFAVDLLSLYVVAKTGDTGAYGLVRDIPEDVLSSVRGLSMSFMERANPTLYENFPAELSPALHQRLAECGIRWYTERDWDEYRTVRDILVE